MAQRSEKKADDGSFASMAESFCMLNNRSKTKADDGSSASMTESFCMLNNRWSFL